MIEFKFVPYPNAPAINEDENLYSYMNRLPLDGNTPFPVIVHEEKFEINTPLQKTTETNLIILFGGFYRLSTIKQFYPEGNARIEYCQPYSVWAKDINSTVGVYLNGEKKYNGVALADLAGHLKYNKLARPGRALFLNGRCVQTGLLNAMTIRQLTDEFKKNPHLPNKVTAPYH